MRAAVLGTFDAERWWRPGDLAELPAAGAAGGVAESMDELLAGFCAAGDRRVQDEVVAALTAAGLVPRGVVDAA